jgi:hypothetical protein
VKLSQILNTQLHLFEKLRIKSLNPTLQVRTVHFICVTNCGIILLPR